MEPHLNAELVRTKKGKLVIVLGSEAQKLKNGKNRMENFTVPWDGELEWKRSIVPILKQVEEG